MNKKIDQELQEIEQSLAQAKSHAEEQVAIDEYAKLLVDAKLLEHQHEKWAKHAREVFVALEQHNFHQAEVLSENVEYEALALTKHVEDILAEIEHFTEEAVIKIDEEAINLEFIALAAVVASVFVNIISAWMVVKAVQAGLKKAVSSL